MKFNTAYTTLLTVLTASSTNAFSATFQKPNSSSQRTSMTQMRMSINGLPSSSTTTSLKAASLTTSPTEAATALIDETSEEEPEPNNKMSYLDDGFVFGLEGSGLERSKGRTAKIVVEGDTLETTPLQRAAVFSTFTIQAGLVALSTNEIISVNNGDVGMSLIQALAVIVSSYALADLGSGILHWSVDNYGNGRTPIMGGIIAAFQGHHSSPWTITEREFCNNVHKLCIPFGIPTVAAIHQLAGPSHPLVSLFFTVFCAAEIMSQELHKWSHMTRKEVPSIVNFLQDKNLIIGRVPHAQHHTAPFSGRYCIVSGLWYEVLDNSGFFRRLEHLIYNMNGVESNAWKLDPELKEKNLRGDYIL